MMSGRAPETVQAEAPKGPRALLLTSEPGVVEWVEACLHDGARSLDPMLATEGGVEEDVILLDLGDGPDRPCDQVERIVGMAGSVPVIALVGPGAEMGPRAIDAGAQDYLVRLEDGADAMIKAMDSAVRRANRKPSHSLMFDRHSAAMIIFDPSDKTILDANEAACQLYGIERGALCSMKVTGLGMEPLDGRPRSVDSLDPQLDVNRLERHAVANGDHAIVLVSLTTTFRDRRRMLIMTVRDLMSMSGGPRSQETSLPYIYDLTLRTMLDHCPVGMAWLEGGRSMRIKMMNARFPLGDLYAPPTGILGSCLTESLPWTSREVAPMIWSALESGEWVVKWDVTASERAAGRDTYIVCAYAVPTEAPKPRTDVLVLVLNTSPIVNMLNPDIGVMPPQRMEVASAIPAEAAAGGHPAMVHIRSVIESMPIGIMITDSNGVEVMRNPYANIIWGLAPNRHQPVERHACRAWWANTGMKVQPEEWAAQRALARGETVIGEMLDIERFDGKRAAILHSAAPLRDRDGRITGTVNVFMDITSNRAPEMNAVDTRRRTNAYLGALIQDMQGTRGAMRSMLAATPEAEARSCKRQLDDGDRLLRSVSILVRLEAGWSKHEMLDIGWMMDDVRSEAMSAYDGWLDIDCPPRIKCFVMGDETLRDMLLNLVGYAMDRSGGKVTVSMSLTKALMNGREYYRIVLEDDASPVPSEMRYALSSNDDLRLLRQGRLGLNMLVVKNVAQTFNGSFAVEDSPHADRPLGCRFVITLPVVYSDRLNS